MLSQPVQAAVSTLQQQALRATDIFEIERIERALDEILRHPESETSAAAQVYSSRGHASETLRERRRLTCGSPVALIEETPDESEYDERVVRALAVAEPGYDQVEFDHWLTTTTAISPRDRVFLRAMAAGEDAASLATVVGISAALMRQRLSRSRRRGRASYDAEMRSA